ncbi:aminotransferase class III-fold pyridoxal phosphate-dependent enzyme [Brenneria izbisi]|uniref:Aminotransferase class III-fold pyridoxal phosphate-dependent enzyme n=1 Tax=Brenneria izbisi TaxID=2939450 RepID=A0AA41XW93_9GAMM|nr:aminotransferase class III-fold pyridoxal phosphate-dependent enzyme [Brenneria izbisi]MCV9880143.1 aminotransferase class III-fold pyridoxal phosphate-dependent enzyme [Brenneria izbisi]MCV9883581.1 aminotransferase class III-fold pyridoxal phosphate-dependent enzyme [Brenneria izbisi]
MKFGFIAHPTSRELLHQVKLVDMTGRMLEEQANGYDPARWRQRNLVPFVEFSRIVSACGAQCEGILQFMPLTAEQMLSQPRRIAERVVEGVNALKSEGAELVGLGGFTSIVGNRGLQTLERTQVPVTTGNSLTAYATYINLLDVLSALDIPPEQAEVAVLGYPGSIALAVARLLAPKGCRLHLVHRDEKQQSAILLNYLPEQFHGQVTLHANVEACYDKIKLFVAATSSGGVIDPQRLAPGSVIVDAALPKDTQPGWEKRDDILVIDGGLVSANDTVNFGALALGLDPKRNLNGCLAETIILALEGRAEPFSIGRDLPVDRVLEIGRIAEHHGFFPRPLTSQGETVNEAKFHQLRRFHGGKQPAALDIDDDPQHLRTEVLRCFGEHINPVLREFYEFNHVERVFNHGQGCWLTDLDGRRYLDFMAGYGCLNTGHNHPRVIAQLQHYLTQQYPTFVQYLSAPLHASLLARRLSELTPGGLERVFLSNSGTEAVEAALKLAMAASNKTTFDKPTIDKPTILYCANGYHGKTLGALSVTGREKHRKVYEPLLPRCEEIPFGDATALQARLLKGDVMAFIMEPIQGEGGVTMPPDGYLSAVRALCSEHQCLWILDEIQTGLGRTGKMFACQWEDVSPDIMVLSKSLSGGLVPIGATLSSKEVWQRAYGNIDRFSLHTSTFGGGNFAAAAALASLDVMEHEDLAGNARLVGAHLRQGLEELARKHYFIKEVRGRGLMLAVEFQNDISDGIEAFVQEMTSRLPAKAAATYRMMPMKARDHLEAAMKELESTMADMFVLRIMTKLSQEHNILTFVTANNNRVMRIQPPLILSLEEAELFIKALSEVCDELSTFEA